MTCDPKKIYADLDVIGTILTYANLWVAGTKKMDATTTTANVEVYTFEYKGDAYYNVFRSSSDVLQSAEIRKGTFVSGMEDAGTLIEKIDYV